MIFKDGNNKTWTSNRTIIGIITSIAVIILAFLQIFNVWPKAIYINEPLMGVVMLIQAMENWQKNKSVAYISLFTSIFLFIVAIFIVLN